MSHRVGFVMDLVAGHVTNYQNLKRVAATDPELDASWHEVSYYVPGGAIERVREKALRFVPSYFSGITRGAWEMKKALRSGDFDALFTNASVCVFFTRDFRRIPTLVDFDSTPAQLDRMPAYTPKADPLPVERLKFWLSRNMMHAASICQAWTRWARDSAIADYGVPAERVVVNPPGIDLTRWQPTQRPADPERPKRVLFVGGDFKRKGGELLLEWFRSRSHRNVELHLVTREDVGSSPGVFVYRNVQPNSGELATLHARSDVFVLPSLGECFGISTIEAMASGLPVVQSDSGGTADIIEPGRNGFIVPAGNTRALGEAIESLLGDDTRRAAFGVASRELACERFDVVKNARRTFGWLKELAERKSRA
jgi:glycosyltransferase involved in cell wall biosynthesis